MLELKISKKFLLILREVRSMLYLKFILCKNKRNVVSFRNIKYKIKKIINLKMINIERHLTFAIYSLELEVSRSFT